MLDPLRQLVREMSTGGNRRTSIVLLTSAVCLTTWHLTGNYNFWLHHLTRSVSFGADPTIAAGIRSLSATVMFLGIVPLLVVKLVLGEKLVDYGMQWGNLRFGAICCLLVTPLVIVIGYASAQSTEFQAIYPLNPIARTSSSALVWHLVGQIFWYASWEFHFRGFLQHGLQKSSGVTTGIWVQTLVSALAHFGRPNVEVFASIAAGLLWGALAWRTRSILSGFIQHWLLGASLDFFLCRGDI
jgi:membrane protease YdiL (CAAX protease family)